MEALLLDESKLSLVPTSMLISKILVNNRDPNIKPANKGISLRLTIIFFEKPK
jgi:hypothetical protein